MCNRIFFGVLLLMALGPHRLLAVGPPIRSTYYDGSASAYASHPHKAAYNSTPSMTIEAWVYREDGSRCETIAGHDYGQSWWFGFCSSLRFYHSGSAVTSTATVPSFQWTHVAVTYDGANARFYVNGVLQSTHPLANAGGAATRPLVIGANPTASGGYNYPFYGRIDELRLWSVARSQSQLSANMNVEVRTGAGLVAAFGSGGRTENIGATAGTLGAGASDQIGGILPRDLVVPKAAVRPTVDGRIYLDSEYLGAEQLALRFNAGPAEMDTTAYLVYTDTVPEKLYVAIGTPRHNAPGSPYENMRVGVFLDPNYTRQVTPQSSHVLLQTSLGTMDPAASEWLNGNGSWFSQCLSGGLPCTSEAFWDVGKFNCGPEFDIRPCAEFAIDKAKLGQWTEFDGLAIGQMGYDLIGSASYGPVGAEGNKPQTWAKVSYGDNTVTLPTAHITGKVHKGLTTSAGGLGNWFVSMNAGGVSATTLTAPDGSFSFNVQVPPEAEINVYVANCGFCKYAPPTFSGSGISGTVVHDLQVRFPACSGSSCTYKTANFFIRQTPGPISISGITPTSPQPSLVLRDNPKVAVPEVAKTLTIQGQNLHEFINVSLSPIDPGLVCPCPDDWVLYNCQVLSVSGDGTSATVRLPTIERRTKLRPYGGFVDSYLFGWRLVVEDTWQRPNMVTYNLYPHQQAQPNFFKLQEPDYPHVWGFGFINKYDDPGWREFSAVYGNNAYYCVFWDLDGDCQARVMDPVYAAFYPIYWLVGKAMTGSCAGMASTSLLFKENQLHAESFDPNVYYPGGFRQVDQNYDASWSRSEVAVLTWPASPTNLWAKIRVGQMTQVSNEFLFDLLGQACLEWEWGPFCGHADETLTAINSHPIGYVAAMINSVTGAHAITPYKVTPGVGSTPHRINIYDNNYTYTDNVGIDVSGNHFTYSPLGYSGSGLFYFPISTWQNSRTAPIFGTADYLYQLVVGSADSLVTTPAGKRWGWLPNGSFVNEIPGSVTATPAGAPGVSSNTTPLLLPASQADPEIKVNAKGGDYFVHAGQKNVMLQMHAYNSLAGDTDRLKLRKTADNSVTSMEFTPQRGATNLLPAVGQKIGADKSVMFRWIGLTLPPNKGAEFGAVKGQTAANYVNRSGATTNHRLLLNGVDGATGRASQVLFGPVSVPNGASQKATITNWPTSTTIRSDIDLNNDGTIDQTSTITGQSPMQATIVSLTKGLPDGALVSLERVVATTARDTFSGFFYCQDPEHATSGIKVVCPPEKLTSLVPGSMLQVIGTMATDSNGERQIVDAIVIINHAEAEPKPYYMMNKAVGGEKFGNPVGQVGADPPAVGTNTIGLLVKTAGRVVARDATTATISDGSAVVKFATQKVTAGFEPGAWVTVTGISACRLEGSVRPRFILPRSNSDVEFH